MKVLHSWLQSYFSKPIPFTEKLADLFTFRFCEVEGITRVRDDSVLDLKVLPDRANYALSHRGVARELSAITGRAIVVKDVHSIPEGIRQLRVSVDDPMACRRYIAALVEGEFSTHDDKVIAMLEVLGQRSVHPVVDWANYIMLDIGQPLHAFDADKIKGSISVRLAREGERILTLDSKDIALDSNVLVISDAEGPIAIAGVKGGKRAEITRDTRRFILESATFDPVVVRRASTRLLLRTEAAKRFENGMPEALAEEGMARFIEALGCPHVMEYSDVYPTKKAPTRISVGCASINSLLGTAIEAAEMEIIFKRLSFSVVKHEGDEYELEVPEWRLDLRIPEDIVEEVGRLHGYETLPVTVPRSSDEQLPNRGVYWIEAIKEFLRSRGFFEVITRTFRNEGAMEVVKSLASDKKFLRGRLTDGIQSALYENVRYADMLELDHIRIFEIGSIFPKEGERTSLCVGIRNCVATQTVKVTESIRVLRDELVNFLGAPIRSVCTIDDSGGIILLNDEQIGTINHEDGILEVNLGPIIDELPAPITWDIPERSTDSVFKPVSQYPSVSRDVSLYVDSTTNFIHIQNVIRDLKKDSKLSNLVRVPTRPFDEYQNSKIGKKSFAFRLVFQSNDRTLTDEEINTSMQHLYVAMKEKGWQVR